MTVRLIIHKESENFISSAFAFAHEIHVLGQAIPSGGTGALWFRGQANVDWELKPSIGRTLEQGGMYEPGKSLDEFTQSENQLLHRFKRDGYPFVQRVLTDWEAITLGQHHQLPTRLLDWTANPLIALFFAVDTEWNVDGVVFGYRPRNLWQHHISMFQGQNPNYPDPPNPLEIRGIKIVFPMLIADRLITQSGGFTIQDPLKCLLQRSDEDFDDELLDVYEIYKWRIPKENKHQILDELHRVSVNRRTLFPGLDGVGYGLRVQEQFRRVKGIWKPPR